MCVCVCVIGDLILSAGDPRGSFWLAPENSGFCMWKLLKIWAGVEVPSCSLPGRPFSLPLEITPCPGKTQEGVRV